MRKHSVLVVDDEVKMQRILEIMLQDMGHEVLRADNGQVALEIAEDQSPDLIITDMRMPVMDGLTLLKKLNERGPLPPVIVITAHGTVNNAVEAMKYGATDYIIRPFEVETVELAVTRALALGQVRRENQYLRDESTAGWHDFIGRSAVMQKLYRMIEQVAASHGAVLVAGETGTGKELVARAVHNASGRDGLFVPINCAAIPESMLESELFGHVRGAFTGAHKERVGKFEIASGGTLFLDEITEMPPALQARLLRTIQENYVERLGSNRYIDIDLRVIAATNRDPQVAVAEQRLREDLYYRLNVFRIDVPPLRDRREDIPLLANHFLSKHARRMARKTLTIGIETLAILQDHNWPGNVRELENLMERVLVLGTAHEIEAVLHREVPAPLADATDAGPTAMPDGDFSLQPHIEALERRLISAALTQTKDNKAKAARLLDISERTLWYKVKKLGLN